MAADELGTCLAQHAVSASAHFHVVWARREDMRMNRPPDRSEEMNEISDGAIMAALGRQMTAAVAKQVVAAGNIANIDTPGYRTREVSFGEMLDGEVKKLGLATTDAKQLKGTGSPDGSQTVESEGLDSRRDGNNVQLDRELFTMTRASADFAAAEAALAAKFRLIRFAINEGR